MLMIPNMIENQESITLSGFYSGWTIRRLSGEAELDYIEYYSEGRKKFLDPFKNIEVREEWNAAETLLYSVQMRFIALSILLRI